MTDYQPAHDCVRRKKAWRENNLEKARKKGIAYTRKYRETNKLKCWARYQVRKALRNGTLCKEPCKVCGSLDVEAHHEDYNKPLDVTWLCGEHHDNLHAGKITILFF